jgi:hypothetical protein
MLDDRFVAFQAKKSGATFAVVYNIATNSIVATRDLGGDYPYWINMSLGTHGVTCWATEGKARQQGVEVYTRNLVFERQIHTHSSHGDFGPESEGHEVYACFANRVVPNASVIAVRLDTGAATVLVDDSPGFYDGYISYHGIGVDYAGQPCALSNRDGSRVLFASGLMRTSPMYGYIAQRSRKCMATN